MDSDRAFRQIHDARRPPRRAGPRSMANHGWRRLRRSFNSHRNTSILWYVAILGIRAPNLAHVAAPDVELINDPNCLSHAVSLLVVARWLAFCAITCLLWLRRSSMETYPSMCVAGVLVVLCWLQLFGPLTWSHYAVFFSPFLGMMVCLAGRGGAWAAVLWCAMLLAFLPWRSIAAPQVMQNALSHFGLSAALLVFATIAVACLVTRRTCSLVVFAGGDES